MARTADSPRSLSPRAGADRRPIVPRAPTASLSTASRRSSARTMARTTSSAAARMSRRRSRTRSARSSRPRRRSPPRSPRRRRRKKRRRRRMTKITRPTVRMTRKRRRSPRRVPRRAPRRVLRRAPRAPSSTTRSSPSALASSGSKVVATTPAHRFWHRVGRLGRCRRRLVAGARSMSCDAVQGGSRRGKTKICFLSLLRIRPSGLRILLLRGRLLSGE